MALLLMIRDIGRRGVVGRKMVGRISTSTGCRLYHRTTNTSSSGGGVVDLRSDTVTKPSQEMLECALTAPLGDDVYGEDPTVLKLEEYATSQFPGMVGALYVPTGTMANLLAMSSHCYKDDASEVLVGAHSHICLWEGGNASTVANLHSRQLIESPDKAEIDLNQLQMTVRSDNDDHFPNTKLLCLENTHNLLGGIPLDYSYIQQALHQCQSYNLHFHMDGARFFHAATTKEYDLDQMFVPHITEDTATNNNNNDNSTVSSLSICLSKGLGAPCGSLLIANDDEFLRIAKRFRKRYGGGMRQVGVIASMGLYALQNNIQRLQEDHERASKLAQALKNAGFPVKFFNTNLVFFALPASYGNPPEKLMNDLDKEYGIKVGGGYKTLHHPNLSYFRAATHMDITDADIERAIDALTSLCFPKQSYQVS